MIISVGNIFAQSSPDDLIHLTNFNSGIEAPVRLAVDKLDNIYVSDANSNDVKVFDASGNIVKVITSVNSPFAVAVNQGGELFISDRNSGEIFKINASGNASLFYAGCEMPSSMVFGTDGFLYVADSEGKKVVALDISANIVKTIGEGSLLYPTSIAIDEGNSRILVGEHGGIGPNVGGGMMGGGSPVTKVWVFDMDGTEISEIGQSGGGDGEFYRIQGVAVGKCGNIYVCDPFQATISIFDQNGIFITKFGQLGGLPGQFNMPLDIAVDSKQQIIVSSLNNGALDIYTVNDTLPTSNIINSDATICAGSQTEIKIEFTGTAPWTFTYTIDGIEQAPVVTSNSPYILTTSTGGLYRVNSLSDANYSATCFSGSAIIKVIDVLPTSSISIPNIDICPGDSAVIPISFTGTSPWTFTYTVNSLNSTTIQTANNPFNLAATVEGLYEVTSVSDAGCQGITSTGAAEVVRRNSPSAFFTGGNSTVEICEGTSTDLSVNLTGNAPWKMQYTIGDSTTTMDIISSPQAITATENGLYLITELSDAYCAGTNLSKEGVNVIVNPNPSHEFSVNADLICKGDSAGLIVNYAGQLPWSLSYSKVGIDTVAIDSIWSFNKIIPVFQQGEFKITELTSVNCADTSFAGSVIIMESNLPESAMPTSSVGICTGDSTLVPVNFTGTLPWNFTYTVDNVPNNLTVFESPYNLAVSKPGLYKIIQLEDSYCQGINNTGSFRVIENPLPAIYLGEDTSICEGNTITLDAGSIFSEYLWNDGSFKQKLRTASGGNYFVKVMDANGCTMSDTILITINPLPISEFSFSSAGNETSFINHSLNSDYYLWDFGDKQTSVEINPVHFYEKSGDYNVSLTSYNDLCGNDNYKSTVNIIALNVEKLNNAFRAKVYPNPSKGSLNLEIENPFQCDLTVELRNINGQTIFFKVFKTEQVAEKVDLSLYANGIYSLKISSKEYSKTAKLILSK